MWQRTLVVLERKEMCGEVIFHYALMSQSYVKIGVSAEILRQKLTRRKEVNSKEELWDLLSATRWCNGIKSTLRAKGNEKPTILRLALTAKVPIRNKNPEKFKQTPPWRSILFRKCLLCETTTPEKIYVCCTYVLPLYGRYIYKSTKRR